MLIRFKGTYRRRKGPCWSSGSPVSPAVHHLDQNSVLKGPNEKSFPWFMCMKYVCWDPKWLKNGNMPHVQDMFAWQSVLYESRCKLKKMLLVGV